MVSSDCQTLFEEIFSNEKESHERASNIDRVSPFCGCQTSRVSKYSIGPIEDNEFVLRLVVVPIHVHTKGTRAGQIKDAALSQAETKGMSIFRETASTEEIRGVAENIVRTAIEKGTKNAGVFGVLRFPCFTVRGFVPQGEDFPPYCVYDTATELLPSHGDVFQRMNKVERPRADFRRKELHKLITPLFIPNADFRSGALMDLYPRAD